MEKRHHYRLGEHATDIIVGQSVTAFLGKNWPNFTVKTEKLWTAKIIYWEQQQDCLSWQVSLEKTRQLPHHQCLQEANPLWSILRYDSHHTPNQSNVVLSSVCITERVVLWPNHQLSLRRRNICHLYMFLMDIPPPLCRRSPSQE